jgi:DNA (cytosine-5)-methyltransferase 1
MGLPDDFTRIPLRKYAKRRITKLRPADRWEKINGEWWLMAADGPRYKALGNSIAVPVLRWIGERIMQVEEIT